MIALEIRLANLERSVKQWRAVTAVLVLALVAGVTVAATKSEVKGLVKCRKLEVVDDSGVAVVSVYPWAVGGKIEVYNHLHNLSTTIGQTFADPGQIGTGLLSVMSREGLSLLEIRGDAHGGRLLVLNKTGTRDEAVQLYVDESGNGVVGAHNRKGESVMLQPGP